MIILSSKTFSKLLWRLKYSKTISWTYKCRKKEVQIKWRSPHCSTALWKLKDFSYKMSSLFRNNKLKMRKLIAYLTRWILSFIFDINFRKKNQICSWFVCFVKDFRRSKPSYVVSLSHRVQALLWNRLGFGSWLLMTFQLGLFPT